MRKLWRKLFGIRVNLIGSLRLTPGDVLVVQFREEEITAVKADAIAAQIKHLIGDKNNVIVLDSHCEVSVIRNYDQEIEKSEE
jgi:hypothetical protein